MASQKIEQLVIAEVEVSLNPSAMANRPGFGSGVRPNHWIPGRHYTYIGQLDFKDREWLKPGESCKAICRFLVPPDDLSLFAPGLAWHICEADRIVGFGRVLSLVND
jgi:hypothetical protein